MKKRGMHFLALLLMVILTAICVSPAQALLYGENIIEGPSFEDMTPWEPTVNGNPPAYTWSWPAGYGGVSQSDEKALDGSYALKLERSGYYNVGARQAVTVVRNRTYSYSMNAALGNGYISPNRFYFDGIEKSCSSPWSSGAWRGYTGTIELTGNGQDTVYLEIRSAVDGGEVIFWDSIEIQRERVIPDPNHYTLNGSLEVNVPVTASIYAVGGFDGTYNQFFDPDIAVSSDLAAITSVTWVSDTQIDVELTPYSTTVPVMLKNQYSDLTSVITLGGSTTIGFDPCSDEYPVGMYDVTPLYIDEDGQPSRIRYLGASGSVNYIHWYGLGLQGGEAVSESISQAVDYLDKAQTHGLKVIMGLYGTNVNNRPDYLGDLHTFTMAVKDHPAMGYWYLCDEPELRDPRIYESDLLPLYNQLKTDAPDILVAIAHSSYTYMAHQYENARDIMMPDNYPVYTDPFPTAEINKTTDWMRTVQANTSNYVIPVCQMFVREDVQGIPSRMPNREELRYWTYATLVQGARGITWFSFDPATNDGADLSWYDTTFRRIMVEFRAFTELVAPAHQPTTTLLKGTDTEDYAYLAVWRRMTGVWVVLVNNQPTERELTLDISSEMSHARLVPWGTTRGGAFVTDGQLNVTARPWESFVWKASLAADISDDEYVNPADLADLASQWLQSTDPQ